MSDPRITVTTYGDASACILVECAGEPGGHPIETIGGEEILRRYRLFGDLVDAARLAIRAMMSDHTDSGRDAGLYLKAMDRLREVLQRVDAKPGGTP